MKPAELSRTNSTLEIETVISDAVGVSVIYEYAYLGDSPSSGVDGDETWHLIGEDSSPVPGKVYDLEDFLERILKGEELPEIGVGKTTLFPIAFGMFQVLHPEHMLYGQQQ